MRQSEREENFLIKRLSWLRVEMRQTLIYQVFLPSDALSAIFLVPLVVVFVVMAKNDFQRSKLS